LGWGAATARGTHATAEMRFAMAEALKMRLSIALLLRWRMLKVASLDLWLPICDLPDDAFVVHLDDHPTSPQAW
jgi:hypothetical protein